MDDSLQELPNLGDLTTRPKYTNGKLESSRMRYLLVGVSRSTKNESKIQPKVAWGSKNRESRKPSFLNEGGKFLSAENVPLPRFLYFGAGVARPSELSSPRRANLPPLFFFF